MAIQSSPFRSVLFSPNLALSQLEISLLACGLSLKVDKLVDQLFGYVQTSDLRGMFEFWEHLERTFFSRLDHAFASSARKLELCLKRYYVVFAVQSGRTDKVQVCPTMC